MARLNPISTLWFWRGLTGHSVTFATLFASVLLGFSISKGLHHLLGWFGFHWLYVLIIPILLFKVLARAEVHWIPDPDRRRSLALGILLGSIALSASISWIRSRDEASPRGVAGSRASP
jgi:threonine/homoserine efflux transporter RhtA